MKKRGMSIVTLIIVTMMMVVFFTIAIVILNKTNMVNRAKALGDDLDLLSLQEMANTAYFSIYFDNLRQGVRRELEGEEIRQRMIEDGSDIEILEDYNITVKDGDVYVTYRGEE